MPSDRTPELPSRRVEAALRARVSAGEWESQERLPSVAQLADEYGVARSAVVSALRRMRESSCATCDRQLRTHSTMALVPSVPGNAIP
jgi:DNA-binding FadR family transcriptional regulator